jgi:hypothetical protein
MKIDIDFSELEDVTCDECDSHFFEQVFLLKKVPMIISPAAQETLAPAQIFRCVDCKHVNEGLKPK